MFGLEAHCLHVNIPSDGVGMIWEWGSPFLVTLVPANFSSSVSVSALYGIDLGGLASL